jgi:hypothetical protein
VPPHDRHPSKRLRILPGPLEMLGIPQCAGRRHKRYSRARFE